MPDERRNTMTRLRRLITRPLLIIPGLATVFTLFLVALPQPAFAGDSAGFYVVEQGASGPNVRAIQWLLHHRGHDIAIDGEFGPATTTAVTIFQRHHGLAADGLVGPQTWSELVVPLEPGMSSDAVRAAKVLLNKHNSDFVVGPNFTQAMADRVSQLKRVWGFPGDDPAIGLPFWKNLVGRSGLRGFDLPVPQTSVRRIDLDNPHHDYPAIDIMVRFVPAYAAMRGTIEHYSSNTCGIGIKLMFGSEPHILYCHLNSRSVGNGVTVAAGTQIGITGETGNAAGNPHLHFEIRGTSDSQRWCPQQWLLAVYDHRDPPPLTSLAMSGCF